MRDPTKDQSTAGARAPVRIDTPSALASDEPLVAEELERLETVARRVHEELREVVRALPGSGASQLSRELGVERTTCQRVVQAVTVAFAGAGLVGKLPGVKGLRQFLAASREAGAEASLVDGAEAAVDALETLMHDLGGSQSRLVRRLEASGGTLAAADLLVEVEREGPIRERLFEAGTQLTGQFSDLSLATFVFRPSPGQPQLIDMGQLRGFFGHHMRRDAMPFSVHWWLHAAEEAGDESFRTLDREPLRGRSAGIVLEQFSSRPLPQITSRGPRDRRVMVIDPSSLEEGSAFDVVTAGRTDAGQPHPAHDTPPRHEVWVLGRFPARVLLFDVFLHRSMARQCIPSVGRYVITPSLSETMDRRWLDRFSGGPTLQLLEPGLGQVAHRAYPRYRQLLQHFFDRLDWDPADYVGYRCEAVYPQWGAGYCMTFDYAGDGDE